MRQTTTPRRMRQWLGRQLALLAVVYNTGHSPEELALLADVWWEEFGGEREEDLDAALRLHRRESARFPTPADLARVLPRCRQHAISSCPALPELTRDNDDTLWRIRARALRDAVRDGIPLEQLAAKEQALRAVLEHLERQRPSQAACPRMRG